MNEDNTHESLLVLIGELWIMNVVWPVTALYLSVLALWGYFRIGRGMARNAAQSMSDDRMQHYKNKQQESPPNPTWRQIAVADTHCGAGCVVGDVIAEFSLFALGWTLLGKPHIIRIERVLARQKNSQIPSLSPILTRFHRILSATS